MGPCMDRETKSLMVEQAFLEGGDILSLRCCKLVAEICRLRALLRGTRHNLDSKMLLQAINVAEATLIQATNHLDGVLLSIRRKFES